MTEEEIDNKILILNEKVIDFRNDGNYIQAIAFAEELRDLIWQKVGYDHPDYAASLNNLAELYRSMGRYNDAEPLFRLLKNRFVIVML
jgi:Tetratricopeptide repeat.